MTSRPSKPTKSPVRDEKRKAQFFIFPRDATAEEMAEHIQALRAKSLNRNEDEDESPERKK